MKLTNIPFNPKKVHVFYGWFILFFGTLGILASVPGQTIGVSVFTDPLIEALSLSRVQVSFAYLIGTISSSFLLTFGGLLYDKFGARTISVASALTLSVVLVLLSRIEYFVRFVDSFFAQSYALQIAFVLLVLGFFALRFSGQGVLTLVSRNVIMKWFNKKRGLANGLSGVFVSLGFSAAPLLFDKLITGYGYSGAWFRLAVFIGVVFSVIAFVFLRDNPEECGLLPDGKKAPLAESRATGDTDEEKSYTLVDAQKTYTFWIYVLALSMFALLVTAITFHIVSIFETSSLPRESAIGIFFPTAVIATSLNLLFGWLSDKVCLKYLLLLLIFGMSLSSFGVIILKPGLSVFFIIIGNGIAQGLFGVLSAVTWPKFFGRAHLGAISGFAMSWMVFSSAIGPTIFGLSQEQTGSYNLGAGICFVILLVLLVLAFFANDPNMAENESV